MLRKSIGKESKTEKDWDVLLPYLLFAYREVPQSSTGFSPFELLYGHTVRGPLDLLSEAWQGSADGEESVVSHILAIRERLEATMEIVEANMKKSQQKQCNWYDQRVRARELAPDDLVLILLPTSQNKLLAKWQGPYRVLKKVGKVNSLVELHDRQKQKRIYHINLLKKWETPITDCYAAEESAEGEEEDIPDWRPQQGSDKPNIGQQLTEQQREEMEELISEFYRGSQVGLRLLVIPFTLELADPLD